mmetsp:Transcript_33312/g.94789  ORF Transcript_33312/g.94789 Transcript_33312/m.94789 type:complete len:356 (-) Transcript_33312:298-1365(-)
MDTTGVRSHFIVDIKEGSEFRTDVVKVTSLVTIFCLSGITMDRVRNPQDRLAFALDSTDQSRKVLSELLGTHANNDRQTSGDVLGVHGLNDLNEFLGGAFVGNLDSQRIANTASKFQVSAVQLPSAFSDPQHVSRTIIPASSSRVHTGQSLFVGQQQTFVGGVKVSFGESGRGSVDTDGLHEAKRFVDLGGKLSVPATLFGLFDKVQVPGMKSRNIGVSSSGESTKDVKCLRTLMVGFDHVERVVAAGLWCKVFPVDIVSAVTGQSDSITNFIGFTTGFGELTCHAANLNDGHRGSKGQDQGHLQDDTEGITNVIDIELVECFGTVSTHEHKSLTTARPRKLFVKRSDLTSKHQR